MPVAGIEPVIPANDRPQTLALDNSGTGIGLLGLLKVVHPRRGHEGPEGE